MSTTGFKYHVFLSHSTADKPAVEELAVRLRREGIEPWLDKWNLIPGQECQLAMERALADCATCAVFIGPGGLGPWQNEEMRAAIARRVGEGEGLFRVIPVLLPGMERPERGKLPTFLTATTWVEFRHSLDDEETFRRLVCGIRGEEPGAGPDGAPFAGECPYRGLEVFEVKHAPFFFGREALTEWLVVALRPTPSGQENRFLAILGASGSGKSSLARAGLVAALERGALDGSDAWPIVILKPGRDPIESLAVALTGLDGTRPSPVAVQGLMAALCSAENTLHLTARLALREAPRSRRLVVLVDQSEEVFTLCEDEAARKALFDNLLYAATIADGQAIVVLTMRADFYGKCSSYPALAAAMSDHQLLVGPMTEDELRRAIERPALLAGGENEPGLVEMLLQDVAGQPGSLPLLQFTLMELWGRREGRRLTVAAYKAIGELQGALKNRADDVLGQFDATRRDLCRRIFLRLTQPGEGIEDTKRRASFGELVPAGADPAAVEAVVRRLADARLITTEGDPKKAGEVSVEVAHEALIRGWGRLREWIDADRAGLLIQRQLTEAARGWEANRREGSFLYGGTRLVVAREWAKTHRDELNARETEFLAASLRKRRRGKVALAASILVMMAVVIGVWQRLQWQKRTQLAHFYHANVWFAKGQDDKAIAAFSEAIRFDPKFTQAYFFRGLVRAEKKKEYDKAIADYDQAIALDPKNAMAYNGRGIAWAAKQAYAKAIADYDQAIALDPKLAMAYNGRGNAWAAKQAYAKAIADYDQAIALDPKNAMAYNGRGIAWAAKQAYAKAIADYDQAIALDPKLAMAYNGRGNAWAAKQAYAKAIADYDQAIALDPKNAMAYNGRGIAWAAKQAYAKAIADYDQAIALDPKLAMAYNGRGNAWAAKQAYAKAIADYDQAIALDPKNAMAYNGRGIAWAAKQAYAKAIADYDQAIALDPKLAMAYNGRGIAWAAKQAYAKAIADYNQAIALDPKFASAYSNRGIAWAAKQAYAKAIADYDQAIALDPKLAMAYNGRGIAWAVKQAYDKAIADYDQAIALDPKLAMAYSNRGNAWYDKQTYDKAIADYDQAIALDPKNAMAYNGRGNAWYAKQAYDKAIAARGGNSFVEYTVPEAVIKLKQGFGRLIRTQSDRGIVVILDPRITTKFYGRTFLDSLPACLRVVEDLRPAPSVAIAEEAGRPAPPAARRRCVK